MRQLENGKMLQEIHEKVTRLDEWRGEVDRKLDCVNVFMSPDGVCERARAKIGRVWSHVKVQWWIIGLLATTILAGVILQG